MTKVRGHFAIFPFLALVAASLSSSASSGELEVRAKLHGYGLLLPKPSYCCEFRVLITSSGQVELQLTVPDSDGMPEDVFLSYPVREQDLSAIRKALDESQYFDLPESVEVLTGFHPEYREMEVRLGERSHEVKIVIPGSCLPGEERLNADTSDRDRALVHRACAVWQAIRSVVKDSRLTID